MCKGKDFFLINTKTKTKLIWIKMKQVKMKVWRLMRCTTVLREEPNVPYNILTNTTIVDTRCRHVLLVWYSIVCCSYCSGLQVSILIIFFK